MRHVKATADGCFVLELEALRHSAVWPTTFKLGGHADFDRLSGGEEWIRTLRSAILIMLRKTGLCETDRYMAEQGVERVPAHPALFVMATGG